MPVPSARLKTYLTGHLDFHASQRWPQLDEVTITWRGGYGYVTGHLPDQEQRHRLGLRALPSQQRKLPRHPATRRQPIRHPRTGPRLRPRPPPRRSQRLDQPPEGLTRYSTNGASPQPDEAC
ncbi:MAG: hypothetical protein ACRDUV_12040, partial [Pseudonocardiaceae bacterium]